LDTSTALWPPLLQLAARGQRASRRAMRCAAPQDRDFAPFASDNGGQRVPQASRAGSRISKRPWVASVAELGRCRVQLLRGSSTLDNYEPGHGAIHLSRSRHEATGRRSPPRVLATAAMNHGALHEVFEPDVTASPRQRARMAAMLVTARLALALKPPRLCTFLFVCHTWP